MSMSDDPRGFRRGQGGTRDNPLRQGHGDRSGPPAGDRYDGYRQPEEAASRPPRKEPDKQPAFSAFRPEAYAKDDGNGSGRPERADWDGPARNAPAPPPRGAPPANAPYLRPAPSPPQDPYYQNAASDPYAPRSAPSYAADWDRDSHQDAGANAFPNYYPPDEGTPGPDAQSVHDRFFAAGAEPEELPPPSGQYRGAFDDHNYDPGAPQGFEPESPHGYAGQPASGYGSEPAQRHHGVAARSTNIEEDNYYGWDKYDQAPPPQAAVRPIHPPAVPDDDLDADFFADEDDYDIDEYEQGRGGGRKKLVAAVLVSAIAVGAGLAYVYKSTAENGGGSPSLIAADSSPIKEEPADPGGRDFPNGNKAIYDRLIGDGSSSPQLAGGAQEAPAQDAAIPGIVTTGTLEERIENALKAQGNDGPAASQEESSPDAPRTVRTVTFGPDGQQQEVQPETQRIAAATPQSETVSSGVVVTSQAAELEAPEQDSAAEEAPQQDAATQVAAVSPQAQSPQIAESAGGSGAFFVQIAARNDQEAAVAAFATLQQKYSGVIGNYSPSVRKVDLGAKGVWYRLLVGPVDSKSDADGLCERLKGAGLKSCFSRKD
jgi:cell division protein FtsN